MLAINFLWYHNKLLNNEDSVSNELAYVALLFMFFYILTQPFC